MRDTLRAYISITGVQRPDEVRRTQLPSLPDGYRHLVGILLAAPATRPPISGRCAGFDEVPAILEAVAERRATAVAHLVLRRQRADALLADLRAVLDLGFSAVQLNSLSLDLLLAAAQAFIEDAPRDHLLIFQLSHSVLAEHGVEHALAEVASLAELASRARGGAYHVLHDPSGGRGVPLDLGEAARFCDLVADRVPRLRPAVAGGLGPETIGSVVSGLVNESRRWVSFDAESGLRDAIGRFDPARASLYLEAAARSLSRRERS